MELLLQSLRNDRERDKKSARERDRETLALLVVLLMLLLLLHAVLLLVDPQVIQALLSRERIFLRALRRIS